MADLQTNLQRLENNSDEILSLVSDISDAIIAKGGTVPANTGLRGFANAINSIPSGGGGSTASRKDVNFYDYDGTIVNSYTATEFAELTAMPDNPSHDGLTAQGWNWTLADAKDYVAEYGSLNIGQMYVTSDGKTRLYVRLTGYRLKPYMGLTGTSSGTTVEIDWGDGSAFETVILNDSTVFTPHEYSEGEYIIEITVTSGSIRWIGDASGSTSELFRKSVTASGKDNNIYSNILAKVELGEGVSSIGNYTFTDCSSLTSITIPSSVTSIGQKAFLSCYSLTSITIPSSVTSIGQSAFQFCYSLTSITIPSLITSIASSTFQNCYSLTSITIPPRVTTMQSYAFLNCTSLKLITIPSSVTSIGDTMFSNCYPLTSITTLPRVPTIPRECFASCWCLSSISISSLTTSIENGAFQYCHGLTYIKFNGSTPPTVSNSKAWTNIPTDCIILAPALVVNKYLNGTNYPAIATYTYLGFDTYESGETLPSTTTDGTYTLIWYATTDDAKTGTNPITQGNGNEVYAIATAI